MTESWRLKLQRAQQHLENISGRLAAIAPEPRERTFRVESERRQDAQWYFSVHLDIGFDAMLPVVIGEFLFNVRSSLDHIACATAHPRSQFPIFTPNIWDEEAQGEHRRRLKDMRRKFDTWTNGMNADVLAIVKKVQPCSSVDPALPPENTALSVLNTYQNADKHRELNVLVGGAGRGVSRIEGHEPFDLAAAGAAKLGGTSLLPDGATFLRLNENVPVEFVGRVEMGLRCGDEPLLRPLPDTLDDIYLEALAIIGAIELVM